MFTKKTPETPSPLDVAISALYSELAELKGDTSAYAAVVDQITKLTLIKDNQSKKGVSAETLAMIGGNIAGIVLILGHERAHVVASKALSFVMKLR